MLWHKCTTPVTKGLQYVAQCKLSVKSHGCISGLTSETSLYSRFQKIVPRFVSWSTRDLTREVVFQRKVFFLKDIFVVEGVLVALAPSNHKEITINEIEEIATCYAVQATLVHFQDLSLDHWNKVEGDVHFKSFWWHVRRRQEQEQSMKM